MSRAPSPFCNAYALSGLQSSLLFESSYSLSENLHPISLRLAVFAAAACVLPGINMFRRKWAFTAILARKKPLGCAALWNLQGPSSVWRGNSAL